MVITSRFKLTLACIVLLSLTNYQAAKLLQRISLHFVPQLNYELSLTLSWFTITLVPVLFTLPNSGLQLNFNSVRKNWREILKPVLIMLVGLGVFVLLGLNKYFTNVKSPILFFLFTPIVEEVLFRGWVFGQLKKMNYFPILGSAGLFAIHHLQYFRYIPTPFALFQITYTFFLGLLFGKMRAKSESVYISILMHILINWVVVSF